MFSIEHDFDATTVTLIDDADAPLKEDAVIHAFEDCITIEQWDPRTDRMNKITLSLSMLHDLSAALDLPEGLYKLGSAD